MLDHLVIQGQQDMGVRSLSSLPPSARPQGRGVPTPPVTGSPSLGKDILATSSEAAEEGDLVPIGGMGSHRGGCRAGLRGWQLQG
ncbi:MAG: hypothetical protein M0027_03920 [Candidatus Dormibacteraeota bacterium]|nr:hypothetical protein [Candidatus Dormibacteraeota bacterium]